MGSGFFGLPKPSGSLMTGNLHAIEEDDDFFGPLEDIDILAHVPVGNSVVGLAVLDAPGVLYPGAVPALRTRRSSASPPPAQFGRSPLLSGAKEP